MFLAWDLIKYIELHREFSDRTFGPGKKTESIIDHIKKELIEIHLKPTDLEEWVDVIILAIDGAARSGHSARAICFGLAAKLEKNRKRAWPDWQTWPEDKAIEHIRGRE
jgi:hypothetical protein